MKFYYTLLACALACTQTLFAQNDLVIFSPDGDKFYLFLNGEQQNQAPKANVKIKGLSDPALKAKVVFEDNSLANIDKTIYFNNEEPNQEHTYQIKLKKGKRSVAFFSYKPIADSKPVTNQEVITFGTPAPAPAPTTTTTTTTTTTVATTNNPNSNPDPNANVNINMNAGPNGVSTTTTSTTDPNANVNINMNANNPQPNNGTLTRPNNNGNVSINMNAGPNGAAVNTNASDPNNPNYDPNFNMSINMNGDPNNPNFNMNVNITDPNANPDPNPNYDPNYNPNVNINMNGNPNTTINSSTSTTYSTTTTTTSTTTTTNPAPTTTTTNPAPATTNNCATTMSELSFKRTMDKMKATTFDSEHLKISKEAVKKNCATTAQIKEIAQVMRHESSKLEFVKHAYTYCIDQQNYDELVDIFVHASNKDEVRNLLD